MIFINIVFDENVLQNILHNKNGFQKKVSIKVKHSTIYQQHIYQLNIIDE